MSGPGSLETIYVKYKYRSSSQLPEYMFGYVIGDSAFLFAFDESEIFTGNSDGTIKGHSAIGTGGVSMITLYKTAVRRVYGDIVSVTPVIEPWENGYVIPNIGVFELLE